MSSRESAVVFTWHSVVTETMNCVLKQDGSDLQWQPDHSDLPTDSTVCVCSGETIQHHVHARVSDPLTLLGGCRMPRVLRVVKLRVPTRHLTGSNF